MDTPSTAARHERTCLLYVYWLLFVVPHLQLLYNANQFFLNSLRACKKKSEHRSVKSVFKVSEGMQMGVGGD